MYANTVLANGLKSHTIQQVEVEILFHFEPLHDMATYFPKTDFSATSLGDVMLFAHKLVYELYFILRLECIEYFDPSSAEFN